MHAPAIELYLERAGLISDLAGSSGKFEQLVDLRLITSELLSWQSALQHIIEENKKTDSLAEVENSLYSYSVPKLSPDGVCSLLPEMAPEPYQLSSVLGDRSISTTRFLKSLDDLIESLASDLRINWLGIYGAFPDKNFQKLVKLAYRGVPSRAEYPITEAFAERSNNSSVGLHGKAVIINNLEVHLQKGGAYYMCDDAVQSEACLPIFTPDCTKVLGIIDAESDQKYLFTATEMAKLIAVCIALGELLAGSELIQ